MKKIIYILIIVGLIAGLTGFFLARRNNNGANAEENQSFLAKINEDREIKENTNKYQPKETKNTQTEGLDINAKSAILVDHNTNEIIYQKDPHASLPPASITKIATVSIALENNKPEDLIKISQKAADQVANKIVMKAGEELHLSDLLYGLMMISANDAADAIAESADGGLSGFIKQMNEKVRMLGLKNTKFKNPSGLDDDGHYSSAYDIATFTRYALLKHPDVINYAGKKEDHSVYPTEHNESHWWGHISGMLYRYPGMIAAKTGYTDLAKSTFIGVAERNGRRLTVVFLGSTDANGDVTKLLDYGFSH